MNAKNFALILALFLPVVPAAAAAACEEKEPAPSTVTVSEAKPVNPPVSEAVIAEGKNVFDSSTCAACHGENGKGTLPGVPDLTGPDSPLMTKPEEELVNNVKTGFRSPGSSMAMPPKGGDASLEDGEIRAVVKFMKKQFAGRR